MPSVVLMLHQRLRRWPTLNRHLVSVPVCWESSHSQYAGGQLFPDPHGNTVCVSTQSPHKSIGVLFPHRCRSSI